MAMEIAKIQKQKYKPNNPDYDSGNEYYIEQSNLWRPKNTAIGIIQNPMTDLQQG